MDMENPCTLARLSRGKSQNAWAREHRVQPYCVQMTEGGCYNKPPHFYHSYLTPQDFDQYQSYRTYKRTLLNLPEVTTFKELFAFFENSPHKAGMALAVQPAEFNRLAAGKCATIPRSTYNALKELGLDVVQIQLSLLR